MDHHITRSLKMHAVSTRFGADKRLKVTENTRYRDIGHRRLSQHRQLTVRLQESADIMRLAVDYAYCLLTLLVGLGIGVLNHEISQRYYRSDRIAQLMSHHAQDTLVIVLELVDWSIDFVKSVGKGEENFLNIVYIFSFIKAYCEKTLGLNHSDTLNFLKENHDKTSGFKSVNDGLKFYNNKHFILASETGDIKKDLLKEINGLKENGVKGYQNAFEIFKEVYGE